MAYDHIAEQIKADLTNALSPSYLELINESHKHIGHAGAKEGRHFRLNIKADILADKTKLEQHRIIFAALGNLKERQIHALSINIL